MADPRVFISSTIEDLKEYRDAAKEAANRADFHPRMMEYFLPGGGRKPYERCMAEVEECDVLVVIVAHRYGWVPDDQPVESGERAKSITWLECERAVKNGCEVLAFVVDEKAVWPAERKETARLTEAIEKGTFTPALADEVNEAVQRLKQFKEWLRERGIRLNFRNVDQLARHVESTLNKWREEHCGSDRKGTEPRRADPSLYLEWVRRDCSTIDVRGLGGNKAHTFPIQDLYIPLTSSGRGERGKPGETMPGPAPLEQALSQRRLVIAGDSEQSRVGGTLPGQTFERRRLGA